METSEEANKITDNILNILDLPKELLNATLELISEEDRSRVRLVSKWFFDIVGRSQFSLGLIMPSEMEHLVRVFGRYNKPISLTFNKPQKLKTADMKHLVALTQLTSLDVNGNIDTPILISLTSKLVSLQVRGHTVVATSTLQHLSNMTCLRVNVTGDASKTAILTNLESLDMTNVRDSWSNLTCPKVTSLTLRSQTSPPKEWLAQFKPNAVALQHFFNTRLLPYQHFFDSSSLHYELTSESCQNLTSLSIEDIVLHDKSEVPWHQLKELVLNSGRKKLDMSALRHVSKCTSLTTLNINSVASQDMVDAIVVREMKQLQSFTMRFEPSLVGSVKNLISQFNKDSLKTLSLQIYTDHEECVAEISKMTKLESLFLSIGYLTFDVDLSSLMTMTRLTSLTLHTRRYFGVDNLTCMTNLNTLEIIASDPNRPEKQLNLMSFPKLTDLKLVEFVNVIDLRGATQLKRFAFDSLDRNGKIELIAEELVNLKQISLGLSVHPIPWTEIAKFTALESLVTAAFDSDVNSISQLQNLKRLTHLSNGCLNACDHVDPNYFTCLTQLQFIEIVVPKTGITATMEPKLPRLTLVTEIPCIKCNPFGSVKM